MQQRVAGGQVQLEPWSLLQRAQATCLEGGDDEPESSDGDGEGVEVDPMIASSAFCTRSQELARGGPGPPVIEPGEGAEEEVP